MRFRREPQRTIQEAIEHQDHIAELERDPEFWEHVEAQFVDHGKARSNVENNYAAETHNDSRGTKGGETRDGDDA